MILIDTHVLIWLVNGDRRLGVEAREAIDAGAAAGRVRVSAIVPWEIALLARKGRIVLGSPAETWIATALATPGVVEAPIDAEISVGAAMLPDPFHADPADRFLVATARIRDWRLLTADRAILAYGAAGHVQATDAAR